MADKKVNPGGPIRDKRKGRDGHDQVTREEVQHHRGRRGYRWRKRPYTAAEKRPADYQIEPARYSSGPGSAQEYHYHRQFTYHDQYAQELAEAQSPPPQHQPQRKGWLL